MLGSLAWVLPQLYLPLWLLTSQAQRNQWLYPTPDIQSAAQGWGKGGKEGDGVHEFAVSHPGAEAEVNADQVATVIWDYFSQLGNNAKKAVEHIQKSELTQQLK